MPETPVKLDAIDYQRLFPWVRLFRAFWIAVDIRKLILAAAALLIIGGGWWVCDQLPFAPQVVGSEPAVRWPWQQSLDYNLPFGDDPVFELRGWMHDPWYLLHRIGTNWQIVLRPLEILVEPAMGLFRADASWSKLAYDTTRLLWELIVWAIFGGAIGRIAAVQFARDQNIGMRNALKFAASRFLDYLSAPLLPLAAVGLLWSLCALGALLGRIPVAGPVIVGVLWGIGLVLGFLMALVLIGVSVGWPLMFATINVEATDGFDGLSRAYNYVFERPWHYLWFTLVAMVYGSVVIFFVWLTANLVVYLAAWAVAWGMGANATAGLLANSPELVAAGRSVPGVRIPPEAAGSWGAILAGIWSSGVALLVVGFVYSYFWTATTIMYFLLRRSVDANDFDEVHLVEEEERDDLLPLVGTAAVAVQQSTAPPPPETTAPAIVAALSDGNRAEQPPVDLAP